MRVTLRIANGRHAGSSFVVWTTPYLIGRHGQANLQIDNPAVSVVHCHVIIKGNEVSVRDLNSTNGTLVNTEMLEPGGEKRLKVGDYLKVGPAVIEVIQEPNGFLPTDINDYTPTNPALPASPKTVKHPRHTEPNE
jgi:pSer/pThr/pTyr-binding forkhead associated (FHA) protein